MRIKKVLFLHAGAEVSNIALQSVNLEHEIVNPVITSPIVRVIRKISSKISVFKKMWLYSLLKSTADYNNYESLVIVFDSSYWFNNLDSIAKKYPKATKIIWYWNPIKHENQILKIDRNRYQIFSFDARDCCDYGLKHIDQFCFRLPVTNFVPSERFAEVVYFGQDKGRLQQITKIARLLDEGGISFEFNILSNKYRNEASKVYDNGTINYLSEALPYARIIESYRNACAILDIVQGKQSGLTLRPLEALVYSKKLITNQNLVSYDFYDDLNIFHIQGTTAGSELASFVHSQSNEAKFALWPRYEVNAWLNRIILSLK